MTKISIGADARETIDVNLVGVEYKIIPPKSALALKVAEEAKKAGDDPSKALSALELWVAMATNKKTATAMMERLQDPEDLLDVQHLSELISAVTEQVAGNPTSSSPATRK